MADPPLTEEQLAERVRSGLSRVLNEFAAPPLSDTEAHILQLPTRDRRGVRLQPLSSRERHVLAFISQGLTNNETGDMLGIAPDTVKTYVQRILAKLNARNRCHAVAIGIREKLIS